jgi:phosphatidylglycerol:prolipoprotein diacylglycerol transferase
VHPILFELPLPRATVPLGLSLGLLALVGVAVAVLGHRAHARDLLGFGAGMALLCALAALGLRGKEASLAPLPLYGFGLMLCAGMLAGWYLCLAHAERDGLSRDATAGTYVAAAVAGLFGARLLYVLTNLRDFGSLPEAFAFRSGGLVFYGGVLGGLAGSIAYSHRRRLDWFAWADAAAPSLAFGSMLGRIGCYFAGCDYGLPLGPDASRFLVRLGTFPRWPDAVAGPGAGSPAWVDQVLYRGLPYDRIAALPVHPTELYEALTSGTVFALLLVLRTRKQFRGQVFLAFVFLYGALRFLLELLRDDPERGFYGPVAAPSVLVAFGFLALAAAFVAGPAQSLARPSLRASASAVAATVPVVAYLALSTRRQSTSLSTSQWIAVLSSIAAAYVWRRSSRGDHGPPAHARATGG